MDNLRMLSKRLDWTRSWLNDFKQVLPKTEDDFDKISIVDTASDDRRVKSIQDNHEENNLDDGESYVLMQRAYSDYTHIKEMDRRNASIVYWDYGSTNSFTTEEWQRFDLDNMFEDQYEIHVGNITKKTAIVYNIAGRAVENAFRDLRSARKARLRLWAENVKYDGYRDIKRGMRAPPPTAHAAMDENAVADGSGEDQRSCCCDCQRTSDDADMTSRMDKHAFYHAAQNAARRRRGGYVHPRYKRTENDVPRYARFRQRKAKKERLARNAEKDCEDARVAWPRF